MAKLYIMCGQAFSGKSTLAKKISERTNARLLSFDQLWVETSKKELVPKDENGWKYIRKVAKEKILASLSKGVSVVYDDTNPKKEHRDEMRSLAKTVGSKSIIIFLNTPLTVIREREIANRTLRGRHEVLSENFEKVLNDMEIPTSEENAIYYNIETDIQSFLNKLTF